MNFSKKNHKIQQVNIKDMSKKYIITALLFSVSLMIAQTTPGTYAVKNININTKHADFGTAYFGADSVIFSSPRSKRSIVRNIWKPNEQPYLDLYVGVIDGGSEIVGKQKIKGIVNTRFHEAIVVFTKDLKTVYFTGNNYHNNIIKNDVDGTLRLQLFKATVNANGEWINVEKLPFNSDQFSTGHPALSADGKKLYFISDGLESIGKTDIFVVDINADGTYSKPVNLGPEINTKEKEEFPFINNDNILYFSSTGHSGNGGLDVFASRIYDTTVSESLNLGAPINGANDDFAFIIKQDKGYFSSNRGEGVGDDDIYNFKALSPLKIECTQMVTGVVKNKDTQKPLMDAVVDLLDSNGNKIEGITTKFDGTFSFEIACSSSYKIVGTKTDFIKDEEAIEAKNDVVKDGINVSLDLTPEKIKNKKILNIKPIYFDLNKSNIRPDAARELDKVVDLMKKNLDIIVESRSHTDSRGKDGSNLSLSDRRAKSTVEYIISKGIDADRISGKGFGETELLNECANFVKCSKAQHQMNRRTEFYIVDYKE
jgi:outer membrane protein OmpA-like peptidoglycan-associated protein